MNASRIAQAVLNIVLVVLLLAGSFYALVVLFNRILDMLFRPFIRARRGDYIERTGRVEMKKRMRAGTLAIAAKNDRDATESLIEITKTRPVA